jgi:two-component system chemotaxis response regulator CheB
MGADGTEGIKQLKDNKKIYVIAQDKPSSTVYGMPKVVAEAGLVNEVVPLDMVSEAIAANVGVR